MENKFYYDTNNAAWVLNNYEQAALSSCYLKHEGDNRISVVMPGVGAIIENTEVTSILSSNDGVTYYTSVSALLAACADFFK